MTIEINVDLNRNLKQYSLSGEISYHEIVKILKVNCENPDNTIVMNALFDLSGANMMNISSDQVLQMATLIGDNHNDCFTGKVAFVVSGEYDFGMTRMFELYLDGIVSADLNVFRDTKEALYWLDLKEKHTLMNYL
jgi:hypothetical protein